MIRNCLLLAAALLLAAPIWSQDAPAGAVAEAEKLFSRIASRPEKAWDYGFTLRRMDGGDDAAKLSAVFERGLDHESAWVRLVCARLVSAKGNGEVAYEALGKLLNDSDSSIVEAAATLVSDEVPDDDELVGKLREAWKKGSKLAAGARVALCEALYLCTGDKLALDQLKEFLLSPDHDLKARAALALSEVGDAATAQGRMEQLAKEPGQLGRLARISRGIIEIRGKIEEIKAGAKDRKEPLLAAEIRVLRASYVDDKFDYKNETLPLSIENLIDQGCRAMTSFVDDYSDFITAAEMKKMEEDQSGRYFGIGAFVAKGADADYIHISQPIYAGPAYKAGVRSGDFLVGVIDSNLKRVDLKGAEVDDAVGYIKGLENTTAVIFVKRRGVEKELTFEIKRQQIEVDTALEEMLPGNVGYVRLTRFGANSTKDMESALANLTRQGMTSLVLDLRDNPGGQLNTVLQIADMFLKENAVISSTGGVYGDWKGRKAPYRANGNAPYPDLPLVVMINENSASGSEMLSGALKDNKRAVVVGKPSFGKGIGQSFFRIPRTDRTLKCTVFSYYLPSGISIDRKNGVGGVTPNVNCETEYLEGWEVYARDVLLKSDKLESYLDAWYRGETKEKLMKLASFDSRDAAAWPEFERFYASLYTQLSREDVRRELRFRLRIRVADDRGAEFTQNYQDDKQLLVGLTELFKGMGKDVKSVAEFAAVIDK